MRFEDLAGRDVVIWGAGREGRAARAELQRRGIPSQFVLTGAGAAPADLASIATTGPAALGRLTTADVVVKSPGVPRTSSEFTRVLELGIPVTSLTDLWLSENAARTLAVTGTKGKSTTSSIIHHLLTSVGVSATLVGNGGTPVTEGDSPDAEVAVTEVSSYQAAELSTSPRVAVVTSLYPEHLPWHGGFDQYVADKLNLVAHGCEVIVVPTLDPVVSELVRSRAGGARVVDPGDFGISSSEETGIVWEATGRLGPQQMALVGRHNFANAALALTAVVAGFGLEDRREDLLAAVGGFTPLAHRLDAVPSSDGRQWIDDSLATAPEAVVAALETYAGRRVVLLLGGDDRGLSFEPLRAYLAQRPGEPVRVLAFGPAGRRWVREAGTAAAGSELADGFADALTRLGDPASSDVVLLSPGAPSFDEFSSYEERAAVFRAAAGRED